MTDRDPIDVTITAMRLPESLDEPTQDARLFREFVDLRNAVRTEQAGGSRDFETTYETALSAARGQTEERQHRFLAIRDSHVIGAGLADVSLHEHAAPAFADVYVRQDLRRCGVGAAIWNRVEEALRAEGRSATQTWVLHPEQPGETRTAATGVGAVPSQGPEVRFLDRAGFTLEQVERMSILSIRGDTADAARRGLEAARVRASGYTLRTWRGRTPDAELEALAQLHARMSTDVPAGALEVEPEEWTAARLAEYEHHAIENLSKDLVRAVAYDSGGVPVAFTLLTRTAQKPAAFQEDTLVHVLHRGHRLGALVKCANLLQLIAAHPDVERVITWNAEENRHMLDVNEQLGFEAVGYEGAWQRRESRAP